MRLTLILCFLTCLFTSCPYGYYDDYSGYSNYKPVIMKRSDLEQSVKFAGVRVLKNPGKIYFKDKYLYINEKYEGIHVIDNSNPANPVNMGFITIPGCIDIAMKQNSIYADNAVDLVAIDISGGYSNPVETKRIRNAFRATYPPDGRSVNPRYTRNMPSDAVIVGWQKITK